MTGSHEHQKAFQDLPGDILQRVLQIAQAERSKAPDGSWSFDDTNQYRWIDTQDIAQLACVCKQWYTALRSVKYISTSCPFSLDQDILARKCWDSLTWICKFDSVEGLSWCSTVPEDHIGRMVECAVARFSPSLLALRLPHHASFAVMYCQKLTFLEVTLMTDQEVLALSTLSLTLETLKVSNQSHATPSTTTLSRLSNLVHLELSGEFADLGSLRALSKLTSLSLYEVPDCGSELIDSLQELGSLSACQIWSELPGLFFGPQLQASLRVIELGYDEHATAIPRGLEGCGQLRKLTCKLLDAPLPAGDYLQHLEVLEVSFAETVLEFPLANVLPKATRLAKLSLECMALGESGVEHLVALKNVKLGLSFLALSNNPALQLIAFCRDVNRVVMERSGIKLRVLTDMSAKLCR